MKVYSHIKNMNNILIIENEYNKHTKHWDYIFYNNRVKRPEIKINK